MPYALQILHVQVPITQDNLLQKLIEDATIMFMPMIIKILNNSYLKHHLILMLNIEIYDDRYQIY